MFFIFVIYSYAFTHPQRPAVYPTTYTIVETIGHIPRRRKTPPKTYVIVELPDSSRHYALIDSTTEIITDYTSNPIP